MTRSNAREIAVHLIFALGFGSQSDQELLDSELTHEPRGKRYLKNISNL